MSNSLESKICILGAQGVGKTSLLHRYVKGTFSPPTTSSTIGASFLTKRVLDVDSGTTVRLQLWDTAGQERFRSITKLYVSYPCRSFETLARATASFGMWRTTPKMCLGYSVSFCGRATADSFTTKYRGASAVVLVYSIVDEGSFKEMGRWLCEMKENAGSDVILHVVGTKADLVAQDPSLRKVAFERCIAFVAANLYPEQASTPPATGSGAASGYQSMDGNSKRSSGFWGQDIGWDCCHEISSSSGEGIEEVFRVITRKLVEQNSKKVEAEQAHKAGMLRGESGQGGGYFDGAGGDGRGSFRVGIGDKRKSWLGFPTPTVGIGEETVPGNGKQTKGKRKGCC